MINLAEVGAFLAAFARAAAFLTAFPLTGDRVVPGKLRLAVAALIALALSAARPALAFDDLFMALPGEILLGLIGGFAGKMVFAGAEAGGQLMGMHLGFGFAGTFDATVADEELPTRRLIRSLTSLAFLSTGGLEASIATLAGPAPAGRSLVVACMQLVDRGGEVLIAAVRLAAPVMIASVVANLAAALASKAAPALNVFSVALALVLVVGAIVLLASGPVISAEILATVRRVAESIPR